MHRELRHPQSPVRGSGNVRSCRPVAIEVMDQNYTIYLVELNGENFSLAKYITKTEATCVRGAACSNAVKEVSSAVEWECRAFSLHKRTIGNDPVVSHQLSVRSLPVRSTS